MRYAGFDELLDRVKRNGKARVAVAAAADKEVLEAIKLAQDQELIEPVLVGELDQISKIAREIGLSLESALLIQAESPVEAAHKAVDSVVDGNADFLMKGLVNSGDFLKAVLRAERGLRTGSLLTHLAAFEIPGYSHLLFVTDGGMNIAPNLEQKKEILKANLRYLRSIDMDEVNVVVIAANEVPNPKMPATLDAKALYDLGQQGEFPGAVVEGPLALDCAVSQSALKHKGIQSHINGEADLILVPTIEVGNVLGKSIVYFAGGFMAGIILGAQVPIVLTSRSDTARSKLMSLALAALNQSAMSYSQSAR